MTANGLFATPSRLAAHTRYVLQDYALMRAALPVSLISFFAFLLTRSALHSAGPKQWADPRFLAGIHSAYGSITGVLVYFTVFLAVIAVMTIDRTTGYYRFYFSKPVNVVSYYLHTFCVHGAALCVILALFALGWSARMPHESLHRAAYTGAIAFALVGGIGFGLGALTNADAALTPLAFVFATSAQMTLIDYTAPPRWLVAVAKVLPPELDFEKVRALINGAHPFVGAPLWHVLAYGAGGWILGLVFLRRRSLAR